MSVLGIASTIVSQFDALLSHGKSHQLQQGFQQLAQDLQSGNLSQAQSDFASLQPLLPTNPRNFAVASSAQNNPLAAAVSQLAKDLQSGNVNAAQSDLATVQQDVQQIGQQQGSGHAHHHHHHHSGSGDSGQSSNDVSTLFGQLGQSLQAGNFPAAQQAYASLQQDFLLSGFNTPSAASSAPTSANLSLSA